MLKPNSTCNVPEETLQVARAAFPKANLYLRLREAFGTLYQNEDFRELFPATGRPALPPWRLALVTVFQFLENLTDRQAADAVRSRIDWKCALGLELNDSGFDFSVLSEFRSRLIESDMGAVGQNARALSRPRAAESEREAADRFDPCAGKYPHAKPQRTRWREPARRPERGGCGGSRVAHQRRGTSATRAGLKRTVCLNLTLDARPI